MFWNLRDPDVDVFLCYFLYFYFKSSTYSKVLQEVLLAIDSAEKIPILYERGQSYHPEIGREAN